MVEAQATARGVRTSAQKAGLVCDLIRGKSVNQALATLQFTRKIIAREMAKVLRSAVANLQQKEGFGGDIDRLYVVGVLRQPGHVDEARAAGSDGSRVPRREADGAPDGAHRGAAAEDREGWRGRRRGGSGARAKDGARGEEGRGVGVTAGSRQ